MYCMYISTFIHKKRKIVFLSPKSPLVIGAISYSLRMCMG